MPAETGKEVIKIAVESASGGWIQWAGGGLLGGATWVWMHVTNRLKKIEDRMVTAAILKEHMDDEGKKFEALFTKHDGIIEKVNSIAQDVAHIKGKLDQ